MTSLSDAKATAARAAIAAEILFREADAAHPAAHSEAVAELAVTDLEGVPDVLAWLHERTGPSKARREAAETELRVARIEALAIEDAMHAEAQASKAQREAVRYGDELSEVRDLAEEALALAAHATMRATGTREVRLR